MKKIIRRIIILVIIFSPMIVIAEEPRPGNQAETKKKLETYQAEAQKDYFREKALEIIDMKTYQKFLEDQLKEAREEIRKLKEAIPTPEAKKEKEEPK